MEVENVTILLYHSVKDFQAQLIISWFGKMNFDTISEVSQSVHLILVDARAIQLHLKDKSESCYCFSTETGKFGTRDYQEDRKELPKVFNRDWRPIAGQT